MCRFRRRTAGLPTPEQMRQNTRRCAGPSQSPIESLVDLPMMETEMRAVMNFQCMSELLFTRRHLFR